MARVDDLRVSVDGIFGTPFAERKGQKIPTSDDLSLQKNDAVSIDATFLYADLAGSARIAAACPWDTTAKIIRAYLECSVRLIRAYGGEVRSFDGDRVMAVFIGDAKNTHASYCAREIDWATEYIIQPRATENFKSVKNGNVKIQQACGIDTGTARAVRAGIRSNNDLIWIGRAPSFAAKLSDCREYPYSTFITAAVYRSLPHAAKFDGDTVMWEGRAFNFADTSEQVYRTKYVRRP